MKHAHFLLVLAFLVAASCKQEPEDSGGDPHVPLVNPFIGVWRKDGGSGFHRFKADGTGGTGAAVNGTFGNDFRFLVYAGQDARTVPATGILVTESGTSEAAIGTYRFNVSGPSITLTAINGDGAMTGTLERVNGSPAPLALSNPFVGEWTADWDSSEHGRTWSWKYRADGTVKTLHHEVRHQFENAYLVRDNILVVFGELRFGYDNRPVYAVFSDNGQSITVTERQTSPAPAVWVFTRVSAAPWL
jgi:hypothetical protein